MLQNIILKIQKLYYFFKWKIYKCKFECDVPTGGYASPEDALEAEYNVRIAVAEARSRLSDNSNTQRYRKPGPDIGGYNLTNNDADTFYDYSDLTSICNDMMGGAEMADSD